MYDSVHSLEAKYKRGIIRDKVTALSKSLVKYHELATELIATIDAFCIVCKGATVASLALRIDLRDRYKVAYDSLFKVGVSYWAFVESHCLISNLHRRLRKMRNAQRLMSCPCATTAVIKVKSYNGTSYLGKNHLRSLRSRKRDRLLSAFQPRIRQ